MRIDPLPPPQKKEPTVVELSDDKILYFRTLVVFKQERNDEPTISKSFNYIA